MLTMNRRACRIAKGEEIFVPVAGLNRDPTIWGDDADELRYVWSLRDRDIQSFGLISGAPY